MKEKWSVVIVAAGKGTRMGTVESKQYLQLMNKPILVHTLERFEHMNDVAEVILVVGKEDIDRCHGWRTQYQLNKIKTIIPGGTERQHSVYLGLQQTSCSWVMVHDGVRPLVSSAAIERCCQQALKHDAAVLAVPVKDTIKKVDASGTIVATPDRKSLWAIQTPQAFRRELLLEAHEMAQKEKFIGTDDAMVVEWTGKKVVVAEGEYTNIKITTPEDLPWAQFLLQSVSSTEKGDE